MIAVLYNKNVICKYIKYTYINSIILFRLMFVCACVCMCVHMCVL